MFKFRSERSSVLTDGNHKAVGSVSLCIKVSNSVRYLCSCNEISSETSVISYSSKENLLDSIGNTNYICLRMEHLSPFVASPRICNNVAEMTNNNIR